MARGGPAPHLSRRRLARGHGAREGGLCAPPLPRREELRRYVRSRNVSAGAGVSGRTSGVAPRRTEAQRTAARRTVTLREGARHTPISRTASRRGAARQTATLLGAGVVGLLSSATLLALSLGRRGHGRRARVTRRLAVGLRDPAPQDVSVAVARVSRRDLSLGCRRRGRRARVRRRLAFGLRGPAPRDVSAGGGAGGRTSGVVPRHDTRATATDMS